MTAEPIACPVCGEQERLRGQRDGEQISVHCEACGHGWTRNRDLCPRCGRLSIADRREPLFQKARGTQQSIIGYRIVQECWACGYTSA